MRCTCCERTCRGYSNASRRMKLLFRAHSWDNLAPWSCHAQEYPPLTHNTWFIGIKEFIVTFIYSLIRTDINEQTSIRNSHQRCPCECEVGSVKELAHPKIVAALFPAWGVRG